MNESINTAMPPIKCNLLSTSTKIMQYNHSTPVHICMTSSAICLELYMLVYTPWRRRRNAFGVLCALCARRRCTVTTLRTPPGRHERSVTTQSNAGRERSLETSLSPWARRDISTLWKMWSYSLYFLVFSCDPSALWEISNHRANAVG